jgi:hypothetical protein
MEIEEKGHLPFLDIDVYRKMDGSLGHKVYRKPTHTNLYLHQSSHHHPANKHCPLLTGTQSKSPMRPGITCTGINCPQTKLSSNKTVTAISKYNEPRNRTQGPTKPKINLRLQPTYHTLKPHTADLAEFWLNTILKASPYHPEKYEATCHQLKMRQD